MPRSIPDALQQIASQREGQIVRVADQRSTDLRVDRLLLGPATRAELRQTLLGYPQSEALLLTETTARTISLDQLADLSEEEALFLPACRDAIHRGGLQGLADVVSRLLEPETGCPWDLEQTHATLKKYLIEESYELIEAIDQNHRENMIEELGDVLLQPLMHAEIARRREDFDLAEVAQRQAEKLVRRHPHVFGDTTATDSAEVLRNWDAIKRHEKGAEPQSLLAGIPAAMPALLRALTISKRAARAGFEWPDLEGVWQKLDEELAELRAEIPGGAQVRVEAEIGDVLFTVVNLARWLKCDPEEALRRMLGRFTARFMAMERASPRPLAELSPEEWDALWVAAKSGDGA